MRQIVGVTRSRMNYIICCNLTSRKTMTHFGQTITFLAHVRGGKQFVSRIETCFISFRAHVNGNAPLNFGQ